MTLKEIYMNTQYTKEKLPTRIVESINTVLARNNCEDIFDHNMWIAGGFPRIIGSILENNLDINNTFNDYFYNNYGDIDVFTNNKENIDEFINKRQHNKNVYTSPFAFNISSEFYRCLTNIQIVTKFFYETYEKCLDNFDFTNCKYLVYKDKHDLFILKDIRAEMLNKRKLLNIDKCVSPLLSNRIIKYFNRHGFIGIDNTPESIASIQEYLFRITANTWDEKFNVIGDLDNIADSYIRQLHYKINFSDEQLSILIGKFSQTLYDKIRSGYGFYLQEIGKTDWASHEIQQRNL